MKFTWDTAKRIANLSKHGLDFADAKAVFEGITFTFEDVRFSYSEQRHITIGLLNSTVVVIAHTERMNHIPIMSMRKATKNERKIYFKGFTN